MQSLDDLISRRLADLADRPALHPPRNPVRSTKKAAQWSAATHRAYSHMSGRIRDPWQREQFDRTYEKTMKEGPDFLKVPRPYAFRPSQQKRQRLSAMTAGDSGQTQPAEEESR